MYHFNLNGKCFGSVSDILVNKTERMFILDHFFLLFHYYSSHLSYLLALMQLRVAVLIQLRLTGDKKVTTRYLGLILAFDMNVVVVFFTNPCTKCFIYYWLSNTNKDYS